MNSIEALAKERGGAIEALSLIGVSSSWIGALAAHPTLFKQYLRDQKRISAKLVHPEPNQTDLSTKAGDIYPAFDLLENTDNDLLAKAMREFADKFSVPRVEVLNIISSLKIEKDSLQLQLASALSKNQVLQKATNLPNDSSVKILLDVLQAQFTQPEDMPEGGKLLRITDLAGKVFHTSTWISESEDRKGYVTCSIYIAYVNYQGLFYWDDIILEFPSTKSKKEITKELLRAASQRLTSLTPSLNRFGSHGGSVLGFVTSYIDFEGSRNYVQQFFPPFIPGQHQEMVIKAISQDFVRGAMEELSPTGFFYTPEQLAKLALVKSMPVLGVVVLNQYDPYVATISCNVYYIEGFLPSKENAHDRP